MRPIVALAAAFVLSACTSSAEKLCTAKFRETLLNPETAKFSDFRPLNTDEQVVYPALLGATRYRMRVRAEGELGNTITDIEICTIPKSGDNCVCTSESGD